MTPDVRDRAGGATLRVKCRPGAPRTRITGVLGGALKLDVAAPPERGKANEEAARFVARAAGVGVRDVVVLAGAGSREKTLMISGITAAELAARLASAPP